MNCKTATEMLSAYLDRELPCAERDAVRLHLADCDACRAEASELRALKGLLLGVRAPEPAPDFESRLMRRVRTEAAKPVRAPLFPRLRPLVAAQFTGLAAACALGTLVFLRTPRADAPSVPEPKRAEVVQAVDYDRLAQGYEAYSRAGDFVSTGLVTTDAP